VLEVVELTCKVAGTNVKPDVRGTGTPPEEIMRQWVDSTKLRTMSGWAPRVNLEEGLRRTADWYRQHVHARRVAADLGATLA
jgi:nucleoside-diphosphate-sugar epimerase